jgi:hypothetical protein
LPQNLYQQPGSAFSLAMKKYHLYYSRLLIMMNVSLSNISLAFLSWKYLTLSMLSPFLSLELVSRFWNDRPSLHILIEVIKARKTWQRMFYFKWKLFRTKLYYSLMIATYGWMWVCWCI